MENKNKNLWIWIGVVLLVVIGVWYWYMNSYTPVGISDDQAIESEEDKSEGSINASSPAVSVSYANALIKYADRRIQFDKTCQARPNTVTYKDNTGIMLDNRSPESRTIKIGTNYTVKAWGFKIVVLPDIYLASKTLLVDCDGSQNVATILVQE